MPTELLSAWPAEQEELKRAFAELTKDLESRPGTTMSLVSRPGISYSCRASAARTGPGGDRPVYCLVDVVLSPTDPWFLSVCFYEDEVDDPEELGNPIPQGLFRETGYCFDVEEYDAHFLSYLKERISEARANAGGRPPV
ncbi:MAG: hypothetical protein V1816_08025 [Pseudomonadota bacterium]